MGPLIYRNQTPSTSDSVLECLDGHAEGAALYTFHQTRGRGQYGNVWETDPGQNLAFSLALPENQVKISGSLFNFHTALLVRDFLANLTENNVLVKWPNDLIIHRKKVCGILLEKVPYKGNPYYIVGIGLNVQQQNFGTIAKAGSLLTQTGKYFDLHDIATRLHKLLSSQFDADVHEDRILDGYNRSLFGRGCVSVFIKNGIRQNGIIRNADREGYVWIDLEQEGLQRFFHKEITMLY